MLAPREALKQVIEVTGENFAALSGKEEMDERRLKMGQNRFLLWRGLGEKWDWGAARVVLEWEVGVEADTENKKGNKVEG